MSAFAQLQNVSKTFDVSAPWLNRVIERKPQTFLHAVSDVSGHRFDRRGAGTGGQIIAGNPPSRGSSSGFISPPPAP